MIAANMTIREQKRAAQKNSDKKITIQNTFEKEEVEVDIQDRNDIDIPEGADKIVEPENTIPKNTRNFKYYEILKSGLTKLGK